MRRWRGDPGLPQDLVGEQVADAGDRSLVEQPRLDRSAPAADQPPELVAPDIGGVGADVAEVRVEDRAAEAAPVAQREARAVVELDGEAVPPGRVAGAVEHDATGHAEVQAERGPVVGLQPQELPPAVGARELDGRSARRRSRRARAAGDT